MKRDSLPSAAGQNRNRNLHEGHRKRLRNRFLLEGLDSFEDHQILELLLFFCIPRRDTNPLAHILLNRFGSLSGVLDADYSELLDTDNVGEVTAEFLKLFPLIFSLYRSEKLSAAPSFSSTDEMVSQLLKRYFSGTAEEWALISLNNSGHSIFMDLLPGYREDPTPPDQRTVIETAYLWHAASVILAGIRPGKAAKPLQEDYLAVQQLSSALSTAGITLEDYIIIAHRTWVSVMDIMMNCGSMYPRTLSSRKESQMAYKKDDRGSMMMELLLSYTMSGKGAAAPYAVTALLERFGKLSGVMDASFEKLIALPNINENSAALLKLVPQLSACYMLDKLAKEKSFYSLDDIADLLVEYYVHRTNESAVLLTFDSKGSLCLDKLQEGTVSRTTLDQRKIIETAYARESSQVILAHNHPGGKAIPSEEDLQATQMLISALSSAGIRLIDHILIAGAERTSIIKTLTASGAILPENDAFFELSDPKTKDKKASPLKMQRSPSLRIQTKKKI